MPNAIKYSASAQTLALKKGNFWIGTGDVGKGPTSTTDYWNGITPPSGGYTIYLNKASGGPSIYTAANDSQLISLSNTIAGQTFATAAAALAWFATQTDKMVFDIDYEAILTTGLVLNVDAGFTPSYPTTGTTWYDMSDQGNNGTLTNGPTFSSANNGSIVFDGADDYVDCGNPSVLRPSVFTSITWIYNTDSDGRQQGVFCSYSELMVAGFFYQIWNSPHKVRYVLGANTGGGAGLYTDITGSTTINLNTWYQIAVTYDGTAMKSYVNGSLDINTNPSNGLGYDAANNKVIIGGTYTKHSGVVSRFKGNISNSFMYNRALSAAEILQNYNAQKSRYGL
jgi:hypothetical protein